MIIRPSTPKFTIAIPVRNGERFLGEAIESVLAQTRPADEVLVVDDASTDMTQAIALSAKWRNRVRYVYNDMPTGFADAFNRVACLAASEYVALLSADDVLQPNFLEAVENAHLSHPDVKFYYVAARYIDAVGNPLSPAASDSSSVAPRRYDGKTYVHNYLTGCLNGAEIHRCAGTVVERRLFVEQCQFRKEAGIMADNDFFIRIAARTDVVGIDRPLASVRLHPGAISSRIESLNLRVAQDYLYQIRFLKADPHFIADGDMMIVLHLAFRSIRLLLDESLLRGRMDLYAAAIRIMRDIESIVGCKTCGSAIAQTGGLLDIIYRHKWVGPLYGTLVATAALVKPAKRATRRLLLTRKQNSGLPLLDP